MKRRKPNTQTKIRKKKKVHADKRRVIAILLLGVVIFLSIPSPVDKWWNIRGQYAPEEKVFVQLGSIAKQSLRLGLESEKDPRWMTHQNI